MWKRQHLCFLGLNYADKSFIMNIRTAGHNGQPHVEKYRRGHNGAHSKCVCRGTGTWVRIPPSPPLQWGTLFFTAFICFRINRPDEIVEPMLCDTSEGVKCFLLKLIWGTLTLTLNIPLHSTKAFIKVTINREKELLDSQFYNKWIWLFKKRFFW